MKNLCRNLLKIVGWNTNETKDTPVIYFRYKLIGIISFIMAIESILNFYNQTTDVNSTYAAFEELLGAFLYACIVFDTWFHPNKYCYLLKLLDGELTEHKYKKFKDESIIDDKNTKQYQFSESVMALTYLLYCFDVPFVSCKTVLHLFFEERSSVLEYKKLPQPWFQSLLFIKIESYLVYSVIVVLQTIYVVLFLGTYCNTCLLISNTMMKLACELRYLSFRISKLGLCDPTIATDLQELKFKTDLKYIVQQHVNIIRVTQKSNKALNFSMLIYNQVLSLHISGTLYRTVNSEDLSQKSSFMFGVILSIFVLYVICYAGQQLANESDEVSKLLMECSWIDKPKSFKQSLRIVMTASKKTLQFKPAGLYSLDHRTCLTVIQASYSYFNLMLSFSH